MMVAGRMCFGSELCAVLALADLLEQTQRYLAMFLQKLDSDTSKFNLVIAVDSPEDLEFVLCLLYDTHATSPVMLIEIEANS
ncbi:hypothetical protein F4782DRAFT_463265 [Xylaria castorea]|nr:hypothetical protein F4782DRAFT_463265 [Xylaria castorea]